MLIIERDAKPKDTIYYISACILEELKQKQYNIEELYTTLKLKYNSKLDYTIYLLSLDFLFLIETLDMDKKGDFKCI